ncbi:MAG: heavy-metal-associated domain-containing protein [Ignavibacteriales bacterium]|nr:heavy-metal-associated domain-containing protein [Ignavibacteriales bacterium]
MSKRTYYILLLFLLGYFVTEAQTNEIKVRVDGLSCPFCAYTLEKKIKETGVVEKLNIDFDEGIMFLNLKEGAKISDEVIKRKVEEAGFTVRKIIRQNSEEQNLK